MKVFRDHFDDLHITECDYSSITTGGDVTQIAIASGLLLAPEHPAYAVYGENGPPAVLVFKKVSKYVESFSPYLKTPQEGGFGPQRVRTLDWENESSAPQEEFTVEGVLLGPPAGWIQIDITAQSFELHIEDS